MAPVTKRSGSAGLRIRPGSAEKGAAEIEFGCAIKCRNPPKSSSGFPNETLPANGLIRQRRRMRMATRPNLEGSRFLERLGLHGIVDDPLFFATAATHETGVSLTVCNDFQYCVPASS